MQYKHAESHNGIFLESSRRPTCLLQHSGSSWPAYCQQDAEYFIALSQDADRLLKNIQPYTVCGLNAGLRENALERLEHHFTSALFQDEQLQ